MDKIINTVLDLIKGDKWSEAALLCHAHGICGFTADETPYEVHIRYYRVVDDIKGFANWLTGLGLAWLDEYSIKAFMDEIKIYNGNLDYVAQFNVKIDDLRTLLRQDGIEIPSGMIRTAIKPYIISAAA